MNDNYAKSINLVHQLREKIEDELKQYYEKDKILDYDPSKFYVAGGNPEIFVKNNLEQNFLIYIIPISDCSKLKDEKFLQKITDGFNNNLADNLLAKRYNLDKNNLIKHLPIYINYTSKENSFDIQRRKNVEFIILNENEIDNFSISNYLSDNGE